MPQQGGAPVVDPDVRPRHRGQIPRTAPSFLMLHHTEGSHMTKGNLGSKATEDKLKHESRSILLWQGVLRR